MLLEGRMRYVLCAGGVLAPRPLRFPEKRPPVTLSNTERLFDRSRTLPLPLTVGGGAAARRCCDAVVARAKDGMLCGFPPPRVGEDMREELPATAVMASPSFVGARRGGTIEGWPMGTTSFEELRGRVSVLPGHLLVGSSSSGTTRSGAVVVLRMPSSRTRFMSSNILISASVSTSVAGGVPFPSSCDKVWVSWSSS